MFTNLISLGLRVFSILAFVIFVVVVSVPRGASAVTVELAKKCDALTAKAFPPREPGNPAAGSVSGTGLAAQNYFGKCVANEGKVDGGPATQNNASSNTQGGAQGGTSK